MVLNFFVWCVCHIFYTKVIILAKKNIGSKSWNEKVEENFHDHLVASYGFCIKFISLIIGTMVMDREVKKLMVVFMTILKVVGGSIQHLVVLHVKFNK
jgi:hypothetical protein